MKYIYLFILVYPHMNINMFRLLLEHGAEPNIQDKTGETALIHAIHGRRWSFESNKKNYIRNFKLIRTVS